MSEWVVRVMTSRTPNNGKSHHPMLMQVSLKGARALVKVFTDLQASAEDIQSWFSVGLEPTIGLVRITDLASNSLSYE